MDVELFTWLLTEDGQRLLAHAEEVQAEVADPLQASAAVARSVVDGTPDGAAALALTQAELRVKAQDKFGEHAARMYFTPDGLEQATRQSVAGHRAARLTAFEAASVLDVGCGIGGDLIAIARAGLTVAGIDRDPVRVAMARANLAALGLGGAVEVADATELDLVPFEVVFADPARRGARGRVLDAEGWEPPWPFVEQLLRRDSCVKVAPGIPHELIASAGVPVEAEWVSDHGEVKEAALWSGSLATTARRATVIGTGGLATLTDEDDPVTAGEPVPVREVGEFLYEPDGAVIRAGLVTAVAAGVQGGLVDPHIAYVTGDRAYATPFARSYRVVEELPYREKALRAALRERHIGRLTIKKRGVSVVPEELRRRLALRGDGTATIVLTRVAGHGRCFLVEPL